MRRRRPRRLARRYGGAKRSRSIKVTGPTGVSAEASGGSPIADAALALGTVVLGETALSVVGALKK